MVDTGRVLIRPGGILCLALLPAALQATVLWSSGPLDVEGLSPKEDGKPALWQGPGPGGAQASMVTTASRVARGYPADTVNFFYAKTHKVVHYFAYILFSPPVPASHKIVNEWLDPEGGVLCRKETIVALDLPDDEIRVGGETMLGHVFLNHISLESPVAGAGQTRVPEEFGWYLVRLEVDGHTVASTPFLFRAAPKGTKPPNAEDIKKNIPDRESLRRRLPVRPAAP